MSTHVVAFRPPDEKWQKMKAVWESCLAVGCSIPREVQEFFYHQEPDDAGVVIDVTDYLEEWHGDGKAGYQIDLKKLPKGITMLRFYNSW